MKDMSEMSEMSDMSEISREPLDQYTFDQTHSTEATRALAPAENGERSEPANLAGRIMATRTHGKVAFADLHDRTGSIQLIAEAEKTRAFEDFTSIHVGDHIGIHGLAGRSKRGEPSVYVSDWVTLARTQVSFPNLGELSDPELKARQRYLDLAVNPDVMQRFMQRSRIVSGIRNMLDSEGFVAVETPILQLVHGGASARPFETHHNDLDVDLSLRIAPELYLKRLIVGGMERVYELGKVFRNEGSSTRHNPEFTMMEVYAAYWDYEDQMDLTERMVARLAMDLHGTTEIEYQGRGVDLTPPWDRKTMDGAVSAELGEEVNLETPIAHLRKLCDQFEIEYAKSVGPGALIEKLFEKTVEKDLWGPVFVTDHPAEISPLAREHRTRPGYTERFEAIVAGRELCNAYTELNDAEIQYERFLQQEGIKGVDAEAMPMDFDYVRALMYGMPPTAGMGIGIDRLAMLLTDAPSISDVILFPTKRPDGFKLDETAFQK